MSDLQIDPITGDLAYEDGDFASVGLVEEIAQRLRLKLGLVQGEWFFDRSLGVPYYSRVFGKTRPDPVSLNAVFVQAILTVEGVLELRSPIVYEFDKTNRIMSLTIDVKTESGNLPITIGVP